MKKAFVLILLAAITLSACTSKDIPKDASTQVRDPKPTASTASDKSVGLEAIEEPSSATDPIQQDAVTDVNPVTATESLIVSDASVSDLPANEPVEESPREPTPTQQRPVEQKPDVTMPVETQPTVTEPVETEPEATQPQIPEAIEPTPAEPIPTEPAPTEPEPEAIDIAALEAYGRSYASSAYGYKGTSACGPGSGAGYFPGATKQILTMADGYSLVCQAIDAQYYRDIACGYSPYEEIDGVTVRCPINIRIEATGDPNVYVIWVYYGGA